MSGHHKWSDIHHKSKWSVVVPTCRPEKFEYFQQVWAGLFKKHSVNLISVVDSPPWEGIPDWIPKRSDMIRSWGFWQAYKAGSEYTLSLDDDVEPQGDIFEAYEAAFNREWPLENYLSVGGLTNTGLEMRGFPYKNRGKEAICQYGSWTGVPDLDACTQILHPRNEAHFYQACVPVPKGVAITTCAMNFCFKTNWTPIMFQFPLYEKRYNRFGDIWSGLVQKKVLDKLDKVMLVNGEASVRHQRVSDPFENLKKEAPGLPKNEYLFDCIEVTGTTMVGCYNSAMESVITYFKKTDPEYADHLKRTVYQWLSLFS